jgi:hypothetical protein
LKTAATNRNDHDRHQNDHSVQGKNGQNKVSDEKESASPENMYANPLDSNGSESDRSAAADEIKTDAATPNSDDADRSEIRSKSQGHEGESADERSDGGSEEVSPGKKTPYVAPGVTDQSDSASNNTRTDNRSSPERRGQGNERQPKGEKEVDAGDMYASQSTIDEPEGDRLSADAPTTSTSSQPVVTITGNNDADRFTGKPFSKNQDRNPRRDDSRKGVVASDGYGNHLNSDEPKESQITNGKNTKPESATPNKNGLDRYESRSGFSGQGQSVSMGKQSQESSEYSTGNQKSSHLDTGEKGLSKKADANRIDGNRNQRPHFS